MSIVRISIKNRPPLKVYSEAFKKQVVREFESGGVTKDQLMCKYGLKGNSMVLQWCRKFGKFDNNHFWAGR
jgi:transposase-like protein